MTELNMEMEFSAPLELNDAELDAVAAGSSLIEISHNNVEVGAQVQVLTNKSGQQQNV
jgi:hypothetical protein